MITVSGNSYKNDNKSGNSYQKNEGITKLATLLFSFEFSDYGATIASKLSQRSIHSITGMSITNLPLRLNHST